MMDICFIFFVFLFDYLVGIFINILIGEQFIEIIVVVFVQCEGCVLWLSSLNFDFCFECVDGSKYGFCQECCFVDWGENGELFVCLEELMLLLWLFVDFQLVELIVCCLQVCVIEQWFGMKVMLSGILYDQEVIVSMKLGDGLYYLVLLLGWGLEEKEVGCMNELVVWVEWFGFEGL